MCCMLLPNSLPNTVPASRCTLAFLVVHALFPGCYTKCYTKCYTVVSFASHNLRPIDAADTSVLSTAAALDPLMELSIPILGSGAKGGEMGEAADVLAEALAGWCFQNAHHADLGLTVRVVCTGRLFAATVEAALDRTIGPLDGADRVG